MNRNRFINPPPPYNMENKPNPINFQVPIPRFNVWPSSLPPIPNPAMPPAFNLPQPKKNYCSTCDLWTVEPYNNHQISPTHLAKQATQRLNRLYQPNYNNVNVTPNNTNINPTPNNTNVNLSNSNNNNSIKRKSKKGSKKNDGHHRRSHKAVNIEVLGQHESNMNDERDNDFHSSDEKSESHSIDYNSKEMECRGRGLEMLIPVTGVFCALCEIFFANRDEAEYDHCTSDAHCNAYKKLLKKVRETKCEKRHVVNSDESTSSDNKRLKTTEDPDIDFQQTNDSTSQDNDKKPESTKSDPVPPQRESEEIEKSLASDIQAPDFSLEFPDDMEDYDEGEIHSNSEPSSPVDKRGISALSKDD